MLGKSSSSLSWGSDEESAIMREVMVEILSRGRFSTFVMDSKGDYEVPYVKGRLKRETLRFLVLVFGCE